MAARGILDSYRKENGTLQKGAGEGAERVGQEDGGSTEAAPRAGSDDAPCSTDCVTELKSRAGPPRHWPARPAPQTGCCCSPLQPIKSSHEYTTVLLARLALILSSAPQLCCFFGPLQARRAVL